MVFVSLNRARPVEFRKSDPIPPGNPSRLTPTSYIRPELMSKAGPERVAGSLSQAELIFSRYRHSRLRTRVSGWLYPLYLTYQNCMPRVFNEKPGGDHGTDPAPKRALVFGRGRDSRMVKTYRGLVAGLNDQAACRYKAWITGPDFRC